MNDMRILGIVILTGYPWGDPQTEPYDEIALECRRKQTMISENGREAYPCLLVHPEGKGSTRQGSVSSDCANERFHLQT